VTARPDEGALLDALGKLLERRGTVRGAEAIEYYRAARARRPRLGIALSAALTRADRAQEAEDVVRDLLRQGLETPAVFNQLGICLYELKKYAAAEAAYHRAIDLAPDLGAIQGNLGICLSDQEKHDAAEAACRRAIGLSPQSANLHLFLGNVLARQKKHPAAVAAYRRAIDLQPDYAVAWCNLGNS
jgi:tetratricopeptide (TPR) repeat protein